MKMKSYLIFVLIWTTIVYDLIAHWVWSGMKFLYLQFFTNSSGWSETQSDGTVVFRTGWLRKLGALDFAGGTVVHITSGVRYSIIISSSLTILKCVGRFNHCRKEKSME
jgi:Amt family ammonium transporter